MKLLKLFSLLLGLGLLFVLESCDPITSDGPTGELVPTLPEVALDYKGIELPQHFGLEGQLIRKDELNNEVATLGRCSSTIPVYPLITLFPAVLATSNTWVSLMEKQ